MANIHNRNHTKDIIHPSNKSGLAWVVETLILFARKNIASTEWEKTARKPPTTTEVKKK